MVESEKRKEVQHETNCNCLHIQHWSHPTQDERMLELLSKDEEQTVDGLRFTPMQFSPQAEEEAK